ncbi:MAG TPA: DUF2231 domain-containing protein, partial [Thermoanaerobaculia bacterium]|nr:DUF2231 domain-containing protein [Thermoanaerobaculia bacterium]
MKTLPIALVERQEWLEDVAEAVQPAVQDALRQLGDGVKDLLHGKWLGHPLHPVLTDIPVGAWTAAMMIDAVELITGNDGAGDAADLAVGVGLAGALGAAVAGAADWSETSGSARRIGVAHALLNVAATGLTRPRWRCAAPARAAPASASRSSAMRSPPRPHTSAGTSSSARASASRERTKERGRSATCRGRSGGGGGGGG